VQVLRPVGDIEQELRSGPDRDSILREQDRPQLPAQRRPAGLTGRQHRLAPGEEALGEPPDLCRLPGAFDPLERDEESAPARGGDQTRVGLRGRRIRGFDRTRARGERRGFVEIVHE
jgi:hypothetical protein